MQNSRRQVINPGASTKDTIMKFSALTNHDEANKLASTSAKVMTKAT
jgi:hypothetical protein